MIFFALMVYSTLTYKWAPHVNILGNIRIKQKEMHFPPALSISPLRGGPLEVK